MIGTRTRFRADSAAGRDLSIGVVGCGRWGRNWVRVLSDRPEVGYVWAVDPDSQALGGARLTAPNVRCASALGDAIDHLDAAVIATPSHLHARDGLELMKMGKHVLIEKPFASSALDAVRLSELATAGDLVCMVGHQLLYHPIYLKLKELVDSKHLGELVRINTVRTGPMHTQADHDVLDAFGPHDFAMVLDLAGQMPSEVESNLDFGGRGAASAVAINLLFPSGVGAQILQSIGEERQRMLRVRGTHLEAIFDDGSDDPTLQIRDVRNSANATEIFVDWKEPLDCEAGHFINCILNRCLPATGPVHAMQVTGLLDRVRHSRPRCELPQVSVKPPDDRASA